MVHKSVQILVSVHYDSLISILSPQVIIAGSVFIFAIVPPLNRIDCDLKIWMVLIPPFNEFFTSSEPFGFEVKGGASEATRCMRLVARSSRHIMQPLEE